MTSDDPTTPTSSEEPLPTEQALGGAETTHAAQREPEPLGAERSESYVDPAGSSATGDIVSMSRSDALSSSGSDGAGDSSSGDLDASEGDYDPSLAELESRDAGEPSSSGDLDASEGVEGSFSGELDASEGAGDTSSGDVDSADESSSGDVDSADESSSGDAEAVGADASPDGKKKRRRRRRRGAGGTSPGAETAASPGEDGAPQKSTGGVFGKYIDAFAGRGSAFELGVAVAGRVVRISPEVVFVDLFGKTDAFMLGEEAHDESGQPLHRPGEMVKNVKVVAVAEDGRVVISSRPVDEAAAIANVEAKASANEPIVGMVYGLNRGGFDIWLDGIRAFCPASQISMRPVDDPESFLGRRGEFVISDLKPAGKDIVVTRRPIIQKDQDEVATRVRATLLPGTVVKGRVAQVKDFGAFIDLGGVEGFIHVSELSWERVDRAQDVLRPNEEIEVVVLRVPGARPADGNDKKERPGRIPLSLKALRDDPWKQVAQRIKVGEKRNGKVVRTAEFGAFVELEPGIDGLLHVSELGKNLKHAKEAVAEGAMIDVLVERVDADARRVSLSKWSEVAAGAIGDGPTLDPRSIRAGAIFDVKVEKIEPQGLLVQIVGVVGKRGRGYLSGMETGTPKGTDLRRAFPPGSTVKVKVVGFEKDGRVKLSRRAMLRDEEREAFHSYRSEVAKKGFGTFGDLLMRAQAKAAEPAPAELPTDEPESEEPQSEAPEVESPHSDEPAITESDSPASESDSRMPQTQSPGPEVGPTHALGNFNGVPSGPEAETTHSDSGRDELMSLPPRDPE